MSYQLVIFDLDGTLIDSVGDIADALNHVLATAHSDGEVARLIGGGVRELLRRAGAPGDLDELAGRFRAAYAERPVVHTRLYLGVIDTLERLSARGLTLAIATNKPGALARAIVERLGIAPHFIATLGEDDVGARKPDPLIVDLLRGRAGATRAATLYVGDSLIDAATAEAARVDLALATWGYEDAAAIRSHPARFHLERFADLDGILEGGEEGGR